MQIFFRPGGAGKRSTRCHLSALIPLRPSSDVWQSDRARFRQKCRGDTGASLREIGRRVAAEVEKYCGTKVNPETIKSRALRMLKATGSNGPPLQPTVTTTKTPKSNEFKRQPVKDGTMRGAQGRGAGRKPKNSHQERPRWPEPEKESMGHESIDIFLPL